MGASVGWQLSEDAKPWEALAQRLSALSPLSASERSLIAGLDIQEKSFIKGESVFAEGEEQDCVYVCMSGWGARYRVLPDGQRQVVDFILPASLFGATNDEYGMHVNSAEALLDMRVAQMRADALRQMARQSPRLACMLSLCMGEECARLSERVVSLGRRDAFARLGHFFLEIHHRVSSVGDAADHVPVPVPQQEIADFLGLTSVHVSRTMRKMMDLGMIRYDDVEVTITNEDTLAKACDFDPARLGASPIPEPIRSSLLSFD